MTERHAGIGMTSARTRTRMIERLRGQGITDEVVLSALLEIPRHIFVDEALAHRAYEDSSLPIGYGQTISNPYTVARMTELLRGGKSPGKVLEIGTGCGYQTAVLSRVCKEVYSVERIAPLLSGARLRLRELRIGNVKLRHADGTLGLSAAAPFDAIIMTAAATHVPQELLGQLSLGGRLIMPIGAAEQRLTLYERLADAVEETVLEPVRFVPLLPGLG